MNLSEQPKAFNRSSLSAPVGSIRTAGESRFMAGVYGWMSGGLGLAAVVATAVASQPELQRWVQQPVVFFTLCIAELAMVIGFSALARRASVSAPILMALFLSYAALNGVTLSMIFLAYQLGSIANVFFVTTGTFVAMSVYGAVTQRDLTSLGSFCGMGLVGVVIAAVVNMWVHSDALGFVLSCAGVVVFVGLTAYDTQKLKALSASEDGVDGGRTGRSLRGALMLYLDFLNLFLSLLRVMGRRR